MDTEEAKKQEYGELMSGGRSGCSDLGQGEDGVVSVFWTVQLESEQLCLFWGRGWVDAFLHPYHHTVELLCTALHGSWSSKSTLMLC